MFTVRSTMQGQSRRHMLRQRKYRSGTIWCFWRWTDVDSEYIVRLHLVKTPWFAICIHWINKADQEPHMHDHPVSFFSIILRGWYYEIRNGWPCQRNWFNYIKASSKDIHRIIQVAPKTVTLCFMGPKTREWGFHTSQGWIGWQAYYKAQRENLHNN